MEIIVITGARGCGKTALCQELLSATAGPVGGFISPAVYEDGKKTGFYLQDVRSGEKRLCGTRAVNGTVGRWIMDPEVIALGNRLLREACPCDTLFIDEIGPLEFEKGEGFTAAFDVLQAGDFARAYVVIRPECIPAFRERGFTFSVIEPGSIHQQ